MKRALLLSVCVVAIGCVSLQVQRLDDIARPTRAADSVAVLDQEPDQPYHVIAVLESSVDGALKGFDDLRRKMIDETAEIGGDALILGSESTKKRVLFVGAPVPTPIFYDEMHLTGEVITFDSPPMRDGVSDRPHDVLASPVASSSRAEP